MKHSESYPIRPIGEDELETWAREISAAFGQGFDPAELETDRHVIELDRTLAAFDGDQIVGTADALSMNLAVPGAMADAAGVSAVSVRATHRRRGVLTTLMRRQLDDIAARGGGGAAGAESLAVLWASEAAIYGRFGYGPAARGTRVSVNRRLARLRRDVPLDDAVLVRDVPADAAAGPLTHVWDRIASTRPGQFVRDERWWRMILSDPDHQRKGFSPLRVVVAERAGHGAAGAEPVGFCCYRTKAGWDPGVENTARLEEIAAVDPPARAALWRFLLGLDLMETITGRLPVDDPLPHLLTDPEQVKARITDNLWVRLVDVGRALGERRYSTPVDVVLDVTDSFCPDNTGRWHLTGDATGATCERTTEPADLALGVEALGAAYLGDPVLPALAAAGRVDERRPGALAATAAAFGWPVAPHCPIIF